MSESLVTIIAVALLIGGIAYMMMTGSAEEVVEGTVNIYNKTTHMFGQSPGKPSGYFE